MSTLYGENEKNSVDLHKEETKEEIKEETKEETIKATKKKNERENERENFKNEEQQTKIKADLATKVKENPELRNEMLRKICEKMYHEFCEMKVLDKENRVDLNRIDDIKNDKESMLYKKVYAMRDFFYNLYYKNYKPNLDVYQLETYVDAEYRRYSYQKDLDILFKNWVLHENKQLPLVTFAKKDVEIAKIRQLSKRKRKIQEFNELFQRIHGKKQATDKENETTTNTNTTITTPIGSSTKNSAHKDNEDENENDEANDDASSGGEDTEGGTTKKGPNNLNNLNMLDNPDNKNNPSSDSEHGGTLKGTAGTAGTAGTGNTHVNCLIQWNLECESESEKINGNKKRKIDNSDNNNYNNNINNNDNNSFKNMFNNEYTVKDVDVENQQVPPFNNYSNNRQPNLYEFCDEHEDDDLEGFEGFEGFENFDYFESADDYSKNAQYAKLVIYDDNYNKEAFIETLMTVINNCDFKKAEAIYNLLKTKGKAENLYFKNFQRAENLAVLLRQSKEKILVDVQPLYGPQY